MIQQAGIELSTPRLLPSVFLCLVTQWTTMTQTGVLVRGSPIFIYLTLLALTLRI